MRSLPPARIAPGALHLLDVPLVRQLLFLDLTSGPTRAGANCCDNLAWEDASAAK
jgi:hypothetical protein